nr:RecName: Full=Thaumatin-like protein 2 [Taxus baccata]
NQCPQAYSYAK